MRKLLFSLFFILSGAGAFGAAPWGAMDDYDQKTDDSPWENQFHGGYAYLIPQIITGAPVRVSLWIPAEDEDKRPKYEEMIAQNYNQWFTQTAKIIRSAGREQEFADVLQILDRGISVKFPKPGQAADIVFHIVPFREMQQACGKTAGGCYIRGNDMPAIYLPKNQLLMTLLSAGKMNTRRAGVHEIGHSVGLSDQYKQARNKNTHDRYSSAQTGKSVMNQSGSLTCDDADGIVNLIDIAQGTARGGNQGWKSLCPKSPEYYIRGQSGLRGPYLISSKDNAHTWFLQEFRQGKKVREQQWQLSDGNGLSPFDMLPETVQQRDGLGRPVLAKGPHGETIYYSYLYERRMKMVLSGGKLVLGEVKTPKWEGLTQTNVHSVIVNQGGETILISANQTKKGGEAVYIRQDRSGQAKQIVRLVFDRKNRLTDTWYGNEKNLFSPWDMESAAGYMSAVMGKDKVSIEVFKAQVKNVAQKLQKWYVQHSAK